MRKDLMSVILFGMVMLVGSVKGEASLLSNGDFQSGDLSGWFVQEDFTDSPGSPLVGVVNTGIGNLAAQLFSGLTSEGVTTVTLGQDIGTIPSTAEILNFDLRFFDAGKDDGSASFSTLAVFTPTPPGSSLDALTVSLISSLGALDPIVTIDASGFSLSNPSLTTVSLLPNGFYRFSTDVSAMKDAVDAQLFFNLWDRADGRLSKAQVDNVDITLASISVVPEPGTWALLSTGLLSMLGKRRFIAKS